jgi:hypothetical protein
MAAGAIGGGNPMSRTQQGLAPLPQAPPGYTYEPNTGRLVQYVGSGEYTQSEAAQKSKLRDRLIGMLDRPEATWGGNTVQWPSVGGFGGGSDPIPGTVGLAGGNFPKGQLGVSPDDLNRPTFYNQRPGGGVAPLAPPSTITMPDNSVAQANIFARAKDQVGQETAGSLASLRSSLAGRGMLGGGAEVRGTQNILQTGQGQLGDTTREQAVTEANRQSDFAKTGYEGAITQRGQDVTSRGQDLDAQTAARNLAFNAAKTNYEGQITQRGQNITAQGQRNPSITALLQSLY